MNTPTTFEAHGHAWTKHNTGDGRPCNGDKKVLVCFKDGTCSSTSSMAAEWWEWDNPSEGEEIIGWRFPDSTHPQEKDELTRLREENAIMRTAIKEAQFALAYYASCIENNVAQDVMGAFTAEHALSKLSPFTSSK